MKKGIGSHQSATKHYDVALNGLIQEWEGRVWCNPPYGKFIML